MNLLLLFFSPLVAILLMLIISKKRLAWEIISVISAGFELLIVLVMITGLISGQTYMVAPLFSVTALGALLLGIIAVVGLFATLHSVGYLRGEQAKEMIGLKRVWECYLLTRLFVLCMYLAVTANNPIIMWIAIEATTLSTVFLISFFNRKADIEAAWKYLIINSVGLLLGLLGTLLFLAQGPSNGGFVNWDQLLSGVRHMDPLMSKFAFILILIGYGTKMGLVPMHTWRPDTYNKAPLPVVALLSGALMNVAFFAILHFKVLIDAVVGGGFSQMLFLFFGIVSLAVPAFIIYTQTNYKRLLAYSSIEHAGIMMLGFGFGGIGIFGALLHMVYHALAKSLLFFVASNTALKYSSSKIADVSGMLSVLPYTSILAVIGFLVIIGIPPSGIFFSELYIFLAGFAHFWVLAVLAIALILLVFAGYLKQLYPMLFGVVPEGIKKGETSLWTVLPIAVLAGLLLIIGLYLPGPLQWLLKESSGMFVRGI
jgi:hydrogenase-4 component F